MKKWKSALAVFGMCLFLGSMTSCKAMKKAKKKRCKCPTFSLEDNKKEADKKAQTIQMTFEEEVAD